MKWFKGLFKRGKRVDIHPKATVEASSKKRVGKVVDIHPSAAAGVK